MVVIRGLFILVSKVVILLLLPLNASIGSEVIEGKVADKDNVPVAMATVTLIHEDTGMVMGHTYSTENGQFTFPAPSKDGVYKILAIKEINSGAQTISYKSGQTMPQVIIERSSEAQALKRSTWNEKMIEKFIDNIWLLLAGVVGWFIQDWLRNRDIKLELRVALHDIKKDLLSDIAGLPKLTSECEHLKTTATGFDAPDFNQDDFNKKIKQQRNSINMRITELKKVFDNKPSTMLILQAGNKSITKKKEQLDSLQDYIESLPNQLNDIESLSVRKMIELINDIIERLNNEKNAFIIWKD